MKYFAKKNPMWPPSKTRPIESYQTYEITSRYALELYKALSKVGKFNLVAVPNHKKGTRVDGPNFSVWGEIATNAQCFKRRLDGTLAREILNKRIADEHKN